MENKEVIKISHKKDKEKIGHLYRKFFEENKRIYLLAGELNPLFYNRIINDYYTLLKDTSVNIICGPYISVEDKLFREYHDIRHDFLGYWWFTKEKGEWWKVHPVFEAAYQNDNVKIHIIKQRYGPHFFIGVDTNDVVIENPHDELNENGAKVYFGDKRRVKEYLSKWHEIKKTKCFEWDKKYRKGLFKPVSAIQKELELEAKIRKEFADSKLLKV